VLGLRLLTNDVVAELNAFVADEHGRPGNEFAYLMLALTAEGTIQKLLAADLF
jgi:hypothetical protein